VNVGLVFRRVACVLWFVLLAINLCFSVVVALNGVRVDFAVWCVGYLTCFSGFMFMGVLGGWLR